MDIPTHTRSNNVPTGARLCRLCFRQIIKHNDNVRTHQFDPCNQCSRETASARLVGIRLERPCCLPECEALQRYGAGAVAVCIPDHPCEPTFRRCLSTRSHNCSGYRTVRKDSSGLAQGSSRSWICHDRKDRAIPDNTHQQMETHKPCSLGVSASGTGRERWTEVASILALSRTVPSRYDSDTSDH